MRKRRARARRHRRRRADVEASITRYELAAAPGDWLLRPRGELSYANDGIPRGEGARYSRDTAEIRRTCARDALEMRPRCGRHRASTCQSCVHVAPGVPRQVAHNRQARPPRAGRLLFLWARLLRWWSTATWHPCTARRRLRRSPRHSLRLVLVAGEDENTLSSVDRCALVSPCPAVGVMQR